MSFLSTVPMAALFSAPHRDLVHEFLCESGAPREQGLQISLAASLAPECRRLVKPVVLNRNFDL